MKFRFTDRSEGSGRLVLLFAGWGQSAASVGRIEMPGYDMAVVCDYRDMEAPWLESLDNYSEIVVMAWSFGVHAAARFISEHPGLPVTARIAVNGTRFTVDDSKGIPAAIFHGTLDSLSDNTLRKFNLRMLGGDRTAFDEYTARADRMEIGELREELKSFDTLPAPELMWDKAFIATADRIIPPDNQRGAWSGGEAVEAIVTDGAHFPDFNALLRRSLTDKSLVTHRFSHAAATYDSNSIPQKRVADRLISMIGSERAEDILEVGCGTGYSTSAILDRWSPRHLYLWDLHVPPAVSALAASHRSTVIRITECDAETAVMHLPAESLDMIVSSSAVQWFNSLRAFLERGSRALRKGGIIAISTFGPGTMREIHGILGTPVRFPEREALRRAIPAGLEVMCLSEESFTVGFNNPLSAMRHVSQTGVNALEAGSSPAKARKVMREYPLLPDGTAGLTYCPIFIVLRKS